MTRAESADGALIRAPAITITLQPDGRSLLAVPGTPAAPFEGGLYTLALLEAFTTPRTAADGLETLAGLALSPAAQADLTGQLMLLIEAGFIRPAAETPPPFAPDDAALPLNGLHFSAPPIHIAMLEDRTRTGRYLQAIRETVRPGDVVVEIGTGTGILAAAAAQAGAGRVYAIEGTPIAEAAGALFAANGLNDRISLIRGWSTQVGLPERADVLISEIIGNEPLGEALLESTHDAVTRFLKPDGARLIPRAIHLYAVPLTLPEDLLAQQQFTPASLKKWKRWYGLAFDSLRSLNRAAASPELILPQELEDCPALAEPLLLAAIDLARNSSMDIQRTVRGTFADDGLLNGLLVGFRLQLTDTLWLSTLPGEVADDNHWLVSVQVLPDVLEAAAGAPFTVEYAYHSARRTHQFGIRPGEAR
jgi:protein arginine N-methyltransferase 1